MQIRRLWSFNSPKDERVEVGNFPTSKRFSKRDRWNEGHAPQTRGRRKSVCVHVRVMLIGVEMAALQSEGLFNHLKGVYSCRMLCDYSPGSHPCGNCSSLNPKIPAAPPQPEINVHMDSSKDDSPMHRNEDRVYFRLEPERPQLDEYRRASPKELKRFRFVSSHRNSEYNGTGVEK